jgi:hypothetical protein
MPAGACGTWPSWWFYSDDNNAQETGEIDVIEGANSQFKNEMTLHAYNLGLKCNVNINDAGSSYGNSGSRQDCVDPADGTAGCEVTDSRSGSFGTGFNTGGGGVYALEWTSSAIRIWFFRHGEVNSPGGPLDSNPNPSNWGKPAGIFAGDCAFGNYFQNLNMRFNTAFCGDNANDFSQDPGSTCSSIRESCASKFSTCSESLNEQSFLLKMVQ